MNCQCGARFKTAIGEARHRHNFPLLCKGRKNNISQKEMHDIHVICDRAKSKIAPATLKKYLIAVHTFDVRLDFSRLMNFPDFSFLHDIYGIVNNYDPQQRKLLHHFLPRCAR